ncbi:MAG: FtsX-like permease family protein [Verrucomicrobia bacterium]|nr:FtsX-like permease family protein [Verrucomicrobiota bacterium]
MKYWPLIWSNLRRRRLRTALTLLSVTVAFLLFGYLAAIRVGFGAGVEVAGIDRLIVRHRVSLTELLPISYRERMMRVPGVTAVVFQTWFGGVYQDPRNFFAQMPVDPEPFLGMFPEFVLAEEAKLAWLRTRTGAIVGRKTAERFGWQVGDRVPILSQIWENRQGTRLWEFELVGVYDGQESGTDTTMLFFRHDYFDENRAFGEGLVGWYTIRVADPERAAEVAQAVDAEFANSSAETKTETEKAFVAGFAKQIGDIGQILTAILSAVFFTILLVTGNTMAQAVRERTEEIGALKAMGYTHTQVLALVLAESCCLAGLGGLLGLGLAALMIAAGDPTGGALPIFYFPARDALVGAVLAVGLGVVSGAFPAWQAMRLRVAEALRRS